jgi:hypothetical protein
MFARTILLAFDPLTFTNPPEIVIRNTVEFPHLFERFFVVLAATPGDRYVIEHLFHTLAGDRRLSRRAKYPRAVQVQSLSHPSQFTRKLPSPAFPTSSRLQDKNATKFPVRALPSENHNGAAKIQR